MKSFIFTKCPACGGQMRFDRPESERFAVICPACNHLFDAAADQFNRNLVPATVLRKGAAPKPVLSPTKPLDIDGLLPPPTAIPVRPIDAGNANRRKAADSTTKKHPAQTHWLARNASLGAALVALLLVGIITSAVLLKPELRASLGIGEHPELALVKRYSSALDDCQRYLFNPGSDIEAPEVPISERLQVLEKLLIDCVRMNPVSDSRHAELRGEMQKLFDSQMMFKESTYSIVPTLKGEQRLKFAKLTALVALIELRLSYGLREVPLGSNEIEVYSRKGILLLRDLDRCLLAAKEEGFDRKLKDISAVLDQLEALAIQRVGSGELRGEMPFEYRLMAKSCEGWHQWCLESEANVSLSMVSQAIEKERTHTWDRFRMAMTATHLPAQEFAAIDRIQGRIQNAHIDRASKNLIAKGDSNSADAGSARSPSASQLAQQGTTEGSRSSSSPLAVSGTSAGTGPAPGLFRATPGRENRPSGIITVGNSAEKSSVESSLSSGQATESSLASRQESTPQSVSDGTRVSSSRLETSPASAPLSGDLDFPAPRHRGPSWVCIKVQSSRPEYIIEQAKAVGVQLKLQIDIQVNGEFITVSFGPYSGSLNDMVKHVSFGTIEIVDGQSRTLFVVDH